MRLHRLALILVPFIIAALGVVHHYLVSGSLFHWDAVMHHEPIVLFFLSMDCGMLILDASLSGCRAIQYCLVRLQRSQ